MAIENLKELDADLDIIQKLGDEPNSDNNLTSAELKEKFDEAGNIIKQYINETIVPILGDAVPKSRTVNKKPLSADIILSAADIDAAPSGFGLGTTATNISNQNLITAVAGKSGFYIGSNVANAPSTGGWRFVVQAGSSSSVVFATNSDTSDACKTYVGYFTHSATNITWHKLYMDNNKPTAADVGAVNPNLLHNWYFGNPVNQRGKTEYTTSGYTVDRWFANSVSGLWISVEVKDGCLTLTHPATTVWHYFAQQCDKNQIIVGETYTFSALTNHGVLAYTFSYSGTELTRPLGHNWNFYTSQRAGHPIFGLRTNVSGATLDVYAVKLEQGSVQTLAHQDSTGAWVLNEIPDKNEELLKCVQFTADSYDSYAGKVVLHTGNKTSGSYTGNSTARTIDTGGLGDFALIYGTDVVGVVGPEGTMKASLSAGPSFDKTVTCRNGILTFGGTGMNLSTVPYHYYIP